MEFADLRTAAAKGADSGALAAMLQPESPIAVGIHQALVNTTVAQQHVDMLQSNRAAVVAARKEALDEKARSMSEARDKLAADVTARMKCVPLRRCVSLPSPRAKLKYRCCCSCPRCHVSLVLRLCGDLSILDYVFPFPLTPPLG